jgi:predicted nicotinamide N-methyase
MKQSINQNMLAIPQHDGGVDMAHPIAEDDNDAPLPLVDLRERVTTSTYSWLEEAERLEKLSNSEDQQAASLFAGQDDGEKWTRIQEWRSSTSTPDGFGGYYIESEDVSSQDDESDARLVKVEYILSSAPGGHGDDLWASSRHVANLMANKETCRELLSPLWSCKGKAVRENNDRHPLEGVELLELGAGGGVPSWTAMWRGARVVCTDQSIPDRIRCLAESAERNRRRIQNIPQNNNSLAMISANAQRARVCPYDWGSSIEEVTSLLQDDHDEEFRNKLFDIVVAADCVYMPELHKELINSIQKLLDPDGVALLPFALHGNTEDSRVWEIIDTAKQEGFHVENLGSVQLTPQAYGMEAKRALVYMLRLTKRCNQPL